MTSTAARLPSRFPDRLTVAVVLVAAVSSGVLALGSILIATASRVATFKERSDQEAAFALALAHEQAGDQLPQLLAFVKSQPGLDLIAASGTEVVASDPAITLAAVPQPMRAAAGQGSQDQANVVVSGRHYLLVSGRAPGSRDVYLFFSESGLNQSLADLRAVLAVGWLAVCLLAAVAGRAIARRTLRPVRAAAEAARSLAAGLLDTRLEETKVDDGFGTWARCFNDMAAALQQKIASLADARDRERAFTSDVAHELRTPLNALVAAVDLVRAGIDDLPVGSRRPVELIASGTERLNQLVADLLELSRMEAGGASLDLETIWLADEVRDVVRLGGWEQQVSVSVPPLPVDTDRRHLERILMNLISNAVRHGRVGVEVRAEPEGASAVLEVVDHGPGIPPADQPHIFERFHKADRSRSSGGSGLGLAIALEHARLLGTDLSMSSDVVSGTRFWFRLPLAAGD